MDDEELKVEGSIFIPTSLDHVWDYLLNRDGLMHWFNANEFVIDVYEGGEIEIPFPFAGDGYHIIGETALIIPKERFAFTWIEQDADGDRWFMNTIVNLYLAEREGGTQLNLIHEGFKYLPIEIRDRVYSRYVSFWGESGIMGRLLELIRSSR
jgi:uncharacterized protein YndB with AHSA1/START domain